MFDFIKQRVALWKWQRSTLGQALRLHTQRYFYDVPALSSFKEETKRRLIADFFSKLATIGASTDARMALRETLADYVLQYAQFQVLCLTEAEKPDTFYRDNPFISGALHHHINEAADHCDLLGEAKWENPELTKEDLVGLANTRAALLLYYVNGLNMARLEEGDKSSKDWFFPFVEACLVNEEFHMRDKLGLPQLLPGVTDSLVYSVFLNLVLQGDPNPFFSWTRDFPDHYLAGEGPPHALPLSA